VIVVITLAITDWAAQRTRSAKEFYAAGRSVSALQNGLALAGDYMSAASFLGIAGLVALKGYDGMIYATGWLVGWPALMFLVAEPLGNLGKYTFADVVAFRLKRRPVRFASAVGGILTVLFLSLPPASGWAWRSLAGSTGRGGRGSRRLSGWWSSTSRLLRVWPTRFQRQHGPLRPVVERVLREFLKCGLLEHGFARLCARSAEGAC
jgi:hypothetical protein